MKKILSTLLMICISLTLFGCTSKSNEEITSLKTEIENLKDTNNNLIDQMKRVDLKLSGDFSVKVIKLISDNVTSDKINSAVVGFYQSTAFLLPVGEEMALRLKEGKSYTFKLLDSIIKDYSYSDFKKGNYSVELFLKGQFVKFELVGEAKESELGLDSCRIKIEEKK